MVRTLGTAVAFAALLSACILGSVSAGVQYTTGIEYPGFTGVIPACALHARMPSIGCILTDTLHFLVCCISARKRCGTARKLGC